MNHHDQEDRISFFTSHNDLGRTTRERTSSSPESINKALSLWYSLKCARTNECDPILEELSPCHSTAPSYQLYSSTYVCILTLFVVRMSGHSLRFQGVKRVVAVFVRGHHVSLLHIAPRPREDVRYKKSGDGRLLSGNENFPRRINNTSWENHPVNTAKGTMLEHNHREQAHCILGSNLDSLTTTFLKAFSRVQHRRIDTSRK